MNQDLFNQDQKEVNFSPSMILKDLKSILFPMIVLFPILCIWAHSWSSLAVGVIFSICLLIVSVLDLRYGMIFDKFLVSMLILAVIFSIAGLSVPIRFGIPAAIFGLLLLLIIRTVSNGGIGGGDVKFVFVLGLWLGMRGLLVALFLAFILGTIFSLVLAMRLRSFKIAIPFGPFLSFGAEFAFLYHKELIEMYKSLFF